jgi:hypothetical protein
MVAASLPNSPRRAQASLAIPPVALGIDPKPRSCVERMGVRPALEILLFALVAEKPN